MQLIPHIQYTFKTNCSVEQARKILEENVGRPTELLFHSDKVYVGVVEENEFRIYREGNSGRFGQGKFPTIRGQFIQTVDGCEIDIEIKPSRFTLVFAFLISVIFLCFGINKIIQFPEDAATYYIFFPTVLILGFLVWHSVYRSEKRKSKAFLEQIFNQNSSNN